MNAVSNLEIERRAEPAALREVLLPGVLFVDGRTGAVAAADPRALELLGCSDRSALEGCWSEVQGALQAAGALGASESQTVLAAPGSPAGRRLVFDWHPRWQPADRDGVLLVRDATAIESLEADLRQASLLRSVAQITPAVAHDLRAPINAMVFNIEVLQETIAASGDPASRERPLRYVNVLREELHRLHQGLEAYIAQISPRGDREESFDLRDQVRELAALLVGPARKQQARVAAEVPDEGVPILANRFLIRQVLLHVAVTALANVPRDGSLEIRLERRNGTARIRFAGGAAGDGRRGPDFGLGVSPQGTEARLWTARFILAGLGGAVRQSPGPPASYEIELSLTPEFGSREKE